jgi:magnesium transporter
MSTIAQSEERVRRALPLADLSEIDAALAVEGDQLREALKKVRAADVGRDLSRRSVEECQRLLRATDDRSAAFMLRSANPVVAANVLRTCEPAHSVRVLGFLPVEKQVAILDRFDLALRERINADLDANDRRDIQKLLSLVPSAVGRFATPKIWRCERGARVRDALLRLRQAEDEIEVAQNLYVTEDERLVGVIPLRRVAIADPDQAIEAIMTRDVLAVAEDTEVGDAAEIIQTHNFLSLPIVDQDHKLVGAVRVDDLLDAALSHLGTGFLNQGGVAGKIAAQTPYFQLPMLRAVRSRITWLVLLFVAETATGTVLRHFEDELARVVALSFFIPLLIGTGGNAGSQTVSTVIRALALGEVRIRDALRVVLKEMSTGLLLGLLLGGIAFGRALLWGVHTDLATCVGLTVLVVCTWANTVGALIPIGAEAVGIDPTVISAPLITTLVDASGLFIYLSVAKILIAQLHG